VNRYEDACVAWRGENYQVAERADGVELTDVRGRGASWLVTGYLFESALASGELGLPDRRDI
jgi:hypothetical protein